MRSIVVLRDPRASTTIQEDWRRMVILAAGRRDRESYHFHNHNCKRVERHISHCTQNASNHRTRATNPLSSSPSSPSVNKCIFSIAPHMHIPSDVGLSYGQLEFHVDHCGLCQLDDGRQFDDHFRGLFQTVTSENTQLRTRDQGFRVVHLCACNETINDWRMREREEMCTPCRRTTIGIFNCSSFVAWMMPCAITSHRMMPPKIFTRIA